MSELKATHQCTICGARWRQLDDFRWNLRSKECGPCCDNVPMGDQIEALEDVAPWSGPLTAEEQGMLDDAWQTHKAATPPPASADALVEVERVARAMCKHDGLNPEELVSLGMHSVPRWETREFAGRATAALSAMSPAGEVERIIAWLRGIDSPPSNQYADEIEAGEYKP